jgi:hypothetical protein
VTWDTPLARPLKPRDHAALETLADARAYVFKLPPAMAGWQAWVRAIELLLAAAANPTKAAIVAATEQLELAMFHSARTDMPADEALKRKKAPPSG